MIPKTKPFTRVYGPTHGIAIKMAEVLRKAEVDEVVTYQQLREAVEHDPQSSVGRNASRKARAIVLEENIIFETIPGRGFRRMSASEVANAIPTKTIRSVRRTSKRGLKKLELGVSKEDYEKIKDSDRLRYNAGVAMLGTIGEMSTERGIRKVEKGLVDSKIATQSSVSETLRLFSEEKKGR